MKTYGDELAAADSRMKNDILGVPLYSDPVSKVGTVVPMANTVSAAIDLYEAILDGKMLQPISVEKVGEDLYDIYVFPQARKDKLMYADRKDRIRVKGEPVAHPRSSRNVRTAAPKGASDGEWASVWGDPRMCGVGIRGRGDVHTLARL